MTLRGSRSVRTCLALALLLGVLVAAEPLAAGGQTQPSSEPAAKEAPPVAGPEVTLRWKAAKERNVYGYLVYRADSRGGPFLRVNPEIVRAQPAAPGEDEAASHSYVFVDREVIAGRTYYYYLDAVSTSGRKHRFSGVLTKTVAAP